jgi:integrase
MPDQALTILPPARPEPPLARAGQAANAYAAQGVFADYLSRKSANTLRTQAAALARFADFLGQAGLPAGDLQHDPGAWGGLTWGLVEGFRNWLVQQGDAVASINNRLAIVKTYARLALKAGAISPEEHALIRAVSGYSATEAKRVDERRAVTRRGAKKAQHVSISRKQARKLKQQPNTAQGRRDALLMALLLDHGLRVGEVARLQVADVDLKAGELRFYRPKVDKVQTHKLSADTLRAMQAWFESGDAPAAGFLLRGSRKGGALTEAGLSERCLTQRVRVLGEQVGLEGLSAHDCRHYWATYWADKVDVLRLQEAGGWSSLQMPRRYVEESAIANEGMA